MSKELEFTGYVQFLPTDSHNERLKKAAHVKPGKEILAWMRKEMIAFIHFGPNTFNERQWGNGKETVEDYQPLALDPAQWVRVCAENGLKHIIPTIKHHDGFCLFHTDTTPFSVQTSRDKTDVAKALEEACREYGIGLGMYLSPWDMHQREEGLWNTPAYHDYFKEQLKELLTHYGKIEELWFDGACGDYKIWEKVPCYRPEEWYTMIHELQPDAVCRLYDPYDFGTEEEWEALKRGEGKLPWSGKAVRWVGNEEGRSRADEWSIQPVFRRQIAESAVLPDLGAESYFDRSVGAVWYPLEVNTTLLNQWFYQEETSRVKSLSRLIETYYQSVGNNGVLLLNLSPDKSGLIPKDQIERLQEFSKFIRDTFSVNLAEGIFPEEWRGADSWDPDTDTAEILLTLPEEVTFDQVMLQEKIEKGQRIAKWKLEIADGDDWRTLVEKGTVGYKCIRRFEKVTAKKLRLTILRSYDTPILNGFGLYLSQIPQSLDEEKSRILQAEPTAATDQEVLSMTERQNSVCYELYQGGLQSAKDIRENPALILQETGRTSGQKLLSFSNTVRLPMEKEFSIVYCGMLKVRKDGIYSMELDSTDGAMLWIGDTLCINNDEPHERKTESCRIRLKEGYYSFRLHYTSFRHPGFLALNLDVDSASDKLVKIAGGDGNGF